MQATTKSWRCGCRRAARLGAIAAIALLSAGCESLPWRHDYLDRLDRIWIGAGDTQARNIRKLAVDPIPDRGPPPPPRYDGRRIMAVMDEHYAREAAPVEDTPGDGAAEAGPEDG